MAADSPAARSGRKSEPPEFLIIAASARFLAESAAARGYTLTTVDGFADAEVRSLAACSVRVPFDTTFDAGGLDAASVRTACTRLLRRRRFAGVIIGPGLDAHSALIRWLSSQLPVFGNRAEVFALCRDRRRFDAHLQRLNIPRPADAAAPMLSKLAGASGGAHVRFESAEVTRGQPDEQSYGQPYSQPYAPGTVVSHLFLASRTAVVSIGWNTQWQSRHDARRPFCYGGAINRSPLDANNPLLARAEDYAARLARDFSLVGLNSADYMLCGDELYLLELNPRIGATMQLHDDAAGGLFDAHLVACESSAHKETPEPTPLSSTMSSPMPESWPTPEPRTHAVLYASRPLAIQDDFDWPAEACDLPAGAVHLAPGEPLCTLTARAATAADTLTQLQRTIRSMNTQLAAASQGAASTDNVWPGVGEVATKVRSRCAGVTL